MKKILILLFLSSFILFACSPSKTSDTEVITLSKTSKSWNGTVLPNYPVGEAEVSILKITIPPKTKLDLHKHPVINAGVLLKGELTVISETNDTLHLKAGEAIVEIVNQWHYGKNERDVPAEIIVFYAGIKGKPITIGENEKK